MPGPRLTRRSRRIPPSSGAGQPSGPRLRAGRPHAAESDLTRALQLAGNSPDVLYNRGFIRQQQGRLQDAVEASYSQALDVARR